MKKCFRCKEFKELICFSKHKSRTDGLADECKECRKKIRSKYYGAEKTQKKRKRLELKLFVRELKTKPCADCGIQYKPHQMDFDHKFDKKFSLNRAENKSKKLILEEIAKCDLVCANCHRDRTYNRLVRSKL